MKRAFLVAISVLFLANTTIALAWNPPCLFEDLQSQSTVQTTLASAGSDCHTSAADHKATQDQPSESSHCEGLCLCAQASSSPSFTLFTNPSVPIDTNGSSQMIISLAHLPSITLSPPERPPNQIS